MFPSVALMFPKVAQTVTTAFLPTSDVFHLNPKSHRTIWLLSKDNLSQRNLKIRSIRSHWLPLIYFNLSTDCRWLFLYWHDMKTLKNLPNFNLIFNYICVIIITFSRFVASIRYGLVVRISGSHPDGPGSIPGIGNSFLHSNFSPLSDHTKM